MPYAKIHDIPIYYDIQGTGIPILLIHPPLLTSKIFAYQQQLATQFQIITFDLRGHGHSGYSPDPITYSLIVEDMIQLLNLLNIQKCYIGGYSTGGSIALAAQLKHPDRFYGGILISAMSEVSDWWLTTRISAASALTGAKAKKLMTLAITYGNSDSIQTFRNLYHESGLGSVENMEQYYRYSLKYNCTAQLHRIQTPQLLLYGLKDKGFHKYARLLQTKLPQNKLIFFRDAKHQLPTKTYAKLNSQIRHWLDLQQLMLESNSHQHFPPFSNEPAYEQDHVEEWQE